MRILALLAALGLIAGAFVIRGTLSAGGMAGALADGTATLTIVCDRELRSACDALARAGHDVTTEDAGASYDRLARLTAATDTTPDAWVTLAPWPAMVDEARTRVGSPRLFTSTAGPLAASPLVLVVWEERAAVLEASCPAGTLDVACVTAAAGDTWADRGGEVVWGPVKPGLSHPARSSTGLAALALATAEELGTAEFGTRRLSEGSYLDWLSRFAASVYDFDPAAGSPLAGMLQTGPAAFDVVFATEAAAVTAIEAAPQRGDQLRVVAVSDAMVDVVVASRASIDAGPVAETVADALADAGWQTASDPGASHLDRPAGSSLPGPGAQTALRTTFTETIRR